MNSKSQTATEYLIILAVVIVIALIVVGVLGGIPGIGGGASESSAKLQLASLKVGITNYMQNSHSTLLEFSNNNPFSIRIDSMTINSKKCTLYPRNAILKQGEKKQIRCYGVTGLDEGTRFDYDFNLSYTDVETGASYTIDPDVDLVGMIAQGSELHTGQTLCYVGDTSTPATCNSTYYGEDGYVDGISKSFSTKSGNVVKDDHTGLYWTSNVSTGKTQPQAVTYCDDLVQGGYSDWRLPNIVELVTVMNAGTDGNPSPGENWATGEYWSSTQDPVTTANYWYVDINSGFFYTSDQAGTTTDSVVCVRGITTSMTLTDGRTTRKSFVDVGDNTVIDQDTGLVWDKMGTSSAYAWTVARTYCDDLSLAGYDNWRLPTVSEAITMLDYYCSGDGTPDSTCNGNYSNSVFDASAEDNYWSGTTPPSNAGDVYVVDLAIGKVGYDDKGFDFYVRCVRDH